MRFKEGSINHRVKREKQRTYKQRILKNSDVLIKNSSYPDYMNFYCELNMRWTNERGTLIRMRKTKSYKKSEKFAERSFRRKANRMKVGIRKNTYNKMRIPGEWRNW